MKKTIGKTIDTNGWHVKNHWHSIVPKNLPSLWSIIFIIKLVSNMILSKVKSACSPPVSYQAKWPQRPIYTPAVPETQYHHRIITFLSHHRIIVLLYLCCHTTIILSSYSSRLLCWESTRKVFQQTEGNFFGYDRLAICSRDHPGHHQQCHHDRD